MAKEQSPLEELAKMAKELKDALGHGEEKKPKSDGKKKGTVTITIYENSQQIEVDPSGEEGVNLSSIDIIGALEIAKHRFLNRN